MNEQVPARRAKDVSVEVHFRGDPEAVAREIAAWARKLHGEEAAPAAEPSPLLLTRAQAARRLGRGEKHISQLVRDGKLRNHGSPNDWRISAAELAQLVGG